MVGTILGLFSPVRTLAFQGRWHAKASRRPWKANVRTGLTALLALHLSSVATAQSDQFEKDIDTPGLVIEATAGWDGTVDRSTPIPISLLISNYSDRILEGQLTLSDPSNGYELVLGEVFADPGSTRRFTSIQALNDWFQCFATLSDGERILWRRELGLITGEEFNPHVNFALFIDDSAQALQLPGALTNSAATAVTEETPVAGRQGRPIRCLTVKSWQVPDHPGPLVVAQAIIFREGADDVELNRVQWRALAEWLCLGGTAFVHHQSDEIIKRLADSAPLSAEAAAESNQFMVRRVGLGAIYQYPAPLFDPDRTETRQLMARTIANLGRNHIRTLANTGSLHRSRGGRADLHRVLVVVFFGFYTFLSGVVAILLFRLTQRRIGFYTVIVVVGASVLSGLLGGLLRFSQGDLSWITVTQAGAGGIVQVGKIDVQSAGGRNTQVAIKGEHPDLQFIGRSRRYYYWNRQEKAYPAFAWQPNLAKNVDDTYQINVPMTPWGRRRLHATAFKRQLQRMDFELAFQPRDPPSDIDGELPSPDMPSGVFSVKLVNHLPFDVSEAWLVIGTTHVTSPQSDSQQVAPGQTAPYQVVRLPAGSRQPITPSPDGLVDVYHMSHLPVLSAAATYEDRFEATFQVKRNQWDMVRSWPRGSLSVPRISRLGTASAWIIGRIEHSPIMSIDEQRSDFVPQEHLHVFVQEILPGDMPDALLMHGLNLSSRNQPMIRPVSSQLGDP